MSDNYLRKATLKVGNRTIEAGGNDDLRIRFSIVTHTIQSPNMGSFTVSNLSKATVSELCKEGQQITLTAGYEGNVGVLFQGEVKQGIVDREEVTDTIVTIYGAEGDTGYNFAKVNKTLAAGWTPQQVADECLKQLKPFGITSLLNLGLDLSKPRGIRGNVLSGDVKDVMRTLAFDLNGQWSIQRDKLVLSSLDAKRQEGAIVVNSNTGMVWLPRQTQAGVYVTTLINPAIQIRSELQINQESIVRAQKDNNPLSQSSATTNALLESQGVADGLYRVIHQEIEGDSRGGPWYMYNTCIGAKTGVETKAQVGQSYGPGGTDRTYQGDA